MTGGAGSLANASGKRLLAGADHHRTSSIRRARKRSNRMAEHRLAADPAILLGHAVAGARSLPAATISAKEGRPSPAPLAERDLARQRLCPFCRPPMTRLAPIQIGPVRIDVPVILAPMTGVSDLPFRTVVRRYGSGLNVTEMIASQATIRETRQSIQKAAGTRSRIRSRCSSSAASRSDGRGREARRGQGAAIIDINMGCPVRKVVNGERDPR